PLHTDIERLTRTGQSLVKNVGALAQTGHWATKLFLAASRAVDFQHDWLRLGNQGQELAALILIRLEQRLEELCYDSGSRTCSTPGYWSAHVPRLFCFTGTCPQKGPPVPVSVTRALIRQPKIRAALEVRGRSRPNTIAVL